MVVVLHVDAWPGSSTHQTGSGGGVIVASPEQRYASLQVTGA